MTPEQLKASILQYAIQGKLVEQRPEEGTGEELFQQIQTVCKHEESQLKRRGKKVSSVAITEQDPPFDIPETWKWVKLGQLGYTNIGLTYSPKDVSNDGIVVLRSSNIQNGKMDYEDIVKVSCPVPDNKICHIGDILICARNGSKRLVGKAALIDQEGMSFGAFMAIFRSVCNPYILHVINSAYFRNTLLGDTGTTTINQITQDMLKNVLIPLPPLEEQHRIVAKIEELLPYVDRYATAYEKLEQFNAKFPEDMKKSILQYAIQGKLVEQRLEEGTGEELYRQIQTEKQRLIKEGKIKKEKPLAEISEDEVPFDIPESWKWVRFGEAYSLSNGTASRGTKGGIKHPVLRLADLSGGAVDVSNIRSIELAEKEYLSHQVVKDDLIFIRVNGTKARVATAFHYKEDNVVSYCDHLFCGHKVSEGILVEYMMYIFNAASTRKQLLPEIKTTAGQNTISQASMAKIIIPLPPLAEQKRIVAKLEEILPLCERLK